MSFSVSKIKGHFVFIHNEYASCECQGFHICQVGMYKPVLIWFKLEIQDLYELFDGPYLRPNSELFKVPTKNKFVIRHNGEAWKSLQFYVRMEQKQQEWYTLYVTIGAYYSYQGYLQDFHCNKFLIILPASQR